MKFGFTPEAEILNARLAMLGFIIAVGTYATTGQIIPGVWWYNMDKFLWKHMYAQSEFVPAQLTRKQKIKKFLLNLFKKK